MPFLFNKIRVYLAVIVVQSIMAVFCQYSYTQTAELLHTLEQGSVGIVSEGITPTSLRCEYHVNPLGIEVVEPRLSWIVVSGQRAQKQSAYQIVVSSDKHKIQANKGDLWDSGKVSSDKTNQIVYAGKKLKSRMSCFWKVRVWDVAGKASTWSKTSLWTMGLLEADDWQGKWIGYDAPTPSSHQLPQMEGVFSLNDCKWVWTAEGEPQKSVPAVTQYFRKKISINSRKTIRNARFYLAVDDKLTLFVNSRETVQLSGWTPVHEIDVTENLKTGKNILAIAAKNIGEWSNPAGLIGKLVVEFGAGETQEVSIDSSWKVSSNEHDGWFKVDFNDDSWSYAREFARFEDEPWGSLGTKPLHLPPPPYLRKVFSTDKTVKHATVYASALGLYELHINGKRVGDKYFTPGWTNYKKRVYYNTYDITNLLLSGVNTIGAILADGWYAGHIGWGHKRNHYGDKPRFIAQLEIEYTDGSRQIIVTDKTWKASYGPELEADLLMGEMYDARLEIPGWDTPAFEDSEWQQVVVSESADINIEAYPGVTVKEQIRIKPIKITQPKKDIYVFDLGQNFSGWVQLKVKGKEGTKVVLRFAEMLNPDGTIYTENLRSARATDTYILKGIGDEIWQPSFTYHGFRYIELNGYPGTPSFDNLTGIVVHSDTPATSSFECSSSMINQLYKNITWSQRSNFIDVPTDCPQRDERLGWTGDAQIFIRTATWNMDVASFFTKWLVDLVDAQEEDGNFPDVAPRIVVTGGGTAGCGDAGIICPWTIYQVYGDTRIVEKNYAAMQKWIKYLKNNSEDHLRPATGYGDWLSISSETPKDVIATAFFAYNTRLLSRMAAGIGKDNDAKKYEELFQNIKKAFNRAYVSDQARIKGDTQTCYILGLHFDLLPEDKRHAAANHLIERIKARQWHLSTGFFGTNYLLPVLTEEGRINAAYLLLNNDTFPSWGYSINNGATTIWERWDGWTEEKGFQAPGMNSFNHCSLGSVGKWMFNTLIGIDTDGPGFRNIIIRPQPGGELSFARGVYNSINGPIISDWKIIGNKFRLKITIPANTTATVYVPAKSAESVTESGKPVELVPGIKFLHWSHDTAVYEIGSGKYRFDSRIIKDFQPLQSKAGFELHKTFYNDDYASTHHYSTLQRQK